MSSSSSASPSIALPLIHSGKVRDMYDAGGNRLLLVASDRLSAFDVILPNPVPGKGEILTQLSNFWFEKTQHIIPNHLTHTPLHEVLDNAELAQQLQHRAIVVKQLRRLPVEAVVRGYIIGSGWKDYQASGQICGIQLPAGLQQAERLPEAIFTPSTKADVGDHDENISFAQVQSLIGEQLAQQVREASIQLYEFAAQYARERGIIIADTKFEFGLDENDQLVLIDEALTPDSSRFWPQESYQVGTSPESFDKQYVRDYLETLDWNKQAPGPELTETVIQATKDRYRQAYEQITETSWGD
ncbi:MAG: phosphoribosylaminoimidazolesuccinocarboxamide synthase [Xanthomonadales bacterium]|nr:phosphoribosylaminoimidazolesuccinocarboxamide synthase [Xanthomonadales bacterium]